MLGKTYRVTANIAKLGVCLEVQLQEFTCASRVKEGIGNVFTSRTTSQHALK